MAQVIEGKWEELAERKELQGRRVRVIVLDEGSDNPWLTALQAWADSHKPLEYLVDDSRESIYSGTVDDPR